MGEFSRTIGEMGEALVRQILKKIGWRGLSGIDIRCLQQVKHSRKNHGLDLFTAYKDPLALDTLATLAISIKYTETTSLRADFTSFAQALIFSAECLKFDGRYANAQSEKNLAKKKHANVIFLLNHSSPDEKSLVKKLADIKADLKSRHEPIYLVDNFRLTFLHKAISFVENLYPKDGFEFVYPDTGSNIPIDRGHESAGKILPVEFITSPVLPFRVVLSGSQKILVLCLNENFDKDSLRRMMGLAQGLTGGWCNKIIIAFPDYQPSKHEQLRDSVYMSFSDNGFADMVEVMCYNNTFKNLERSPIAEFVDSADSSMTSLTVDTMLPFGDRIRQLLVQSYIYKNDLITLLSQRGVFVDEQSNKTDLIPLLARTLLSPSEFEFLRRRQIQKENAEKVSTQNLPVTESFHHESILPFLQSSIGKGLIDKIIEQSTFNCKLLGAPSFELDDNGDIKLSFKIQREDLAKDWARAFANFEGQVIIKPSQTNTEGSSCRIDTISTSNETKLISKQLIEHIISELQRQGFIAAGTQATKLLASSLANRSNFLFSFISPIENLSDLVKFSELLSIEFKISSRIGDAISEDVESLKNKVDKSVFSGHKLEDIRYVSDPKYREVFDYYIMVCVFQVTAPYFKGRIQTEFGFPDLKSKSAEKVEFEFKLMEMHTADGSILGTREYHEIELAIREEFNNMKETAAL